MMRAMRARLCRKWFAEWRVSKIKHLALDQQAAPSIVK
jgi:hypothetical protein